MATTNDAPRSAADPRPNGEPFYIDSDCPDCGTPLVLVDHHDPCRHEGPVWNDEWVCAECEDGVHLDWPQDALDGLQGDPGCIELAGHFEDARRDDG